MALSSTLISLLWRVQSSEVMNLNYINHRFIWIYVNISLQLELTMNGNKATLKIDAVLCFVWTVYKPTMERY